MFYRLLISKRSYSLKDYRLLDICVGLLFTNLALTANAEIPIEHFAKPPVFSNPKISPDGKRIAYELIKNGEKLLVVLPVPKNGETLEEKMRPIGIGDKKFNDFYWANNSRLILDIRTVKIGKRSGDSYGRLLAVDIDPKGAGPIDLSARLKKPDFDAVFRVARGDYNPYFIDRLKTEPNKVLASLRRTVIDHQISGGDKYVGPEFHKVNIYNGEVKPVDTKKAFGSIYADNSGKIRLAGGFTRHGARTKSKYTLQYRKDEKSSWEKLLSLSSTDKDVLFPLRFDFDNPDILLVVNRSQSSGEQFIDETKIPIFRYDLTSQKIIGIHKSEEQIRAHSLIAKHLPEYKHHIISTDDDRTSFVVQSYASDKPTVYYLVDTLGPALVRLGRPYPQLDSYRLSERKETTLEARDGKKIFAYLTMPHKNSGSKQPPLVVMPHGGPFDKDEAGFDRLAHFFADRGFAVLQPQYRGSTGFGYEYEKSGYGELSGLIQNDISDSVRSLMKTGKVDRDKICIVGHGFGGFSAAWASFNEDLYRCGISWNGPLRIEKFIRDNDYSLLASNGRPMFNSRQQIWEASPFYNSEKINIPLLMIASRGDTLAPYVDTKNMYSKMFKNGQDAHYIELKDAEHEGGSEKNELLMLKSMLNFLNRHIGTPD